MTRASSQDMLSVERLAHDRKESLPGTAEQFSVGEPLSISKLRLDYVNIPKLPSRPVQSTSSCNNVQNASIPVRAMYASSRLRQLRFARMTGQQPLSYSAALGQGNTPSIKTGEPTPVPTRNERPQQEPPRRQEPSPSHIPRTGSEEENVYVLTILTDKAHHARMTELRKQYFPTRLNKLAAHLTLFHALPGSRLESDIIPTLEEISSATHSFQVLADKPFRLKKGIAVSVSAQKGGSQGKKIHQALQDRWRSFLSDQDAGGCQLHYTLMNKVDDEREVAKAFQEVMENWKPDSGTAEGLALWRYERGFWRWERKFEFQA